MKLKTNYQYSFIYLLCLGLLILWTVHQDIVLPWLYQKGASAIIIRFGLVSKDLLMLFLFIIVLFKTKLFLNLKPSIPLFSVIIYLIVLSLYLFVGNAEIRIKLISLRALALPGILFIIGYGFEYSYRFSKYIVYFLILMGIYIMLFGFVERFGLSLNFWSHTVGLGKFIAEIKGAQGYVIEGLHSNIYSHFGRRMVGIFGNPLSFAYFLMLPFCLCFVLFHYSEKYQGCMNGIKWVFHPMVPITFFLFLAVLFSICRAILLALFGSVLFFLLWDKQWKTFLYGSFIVLILMIVLVPYWMPIFLQTVFMEDSSALSHWDDFIYGIHLIHQHWLGRGLGSAGAWAIVMDEQTKGPGEVSYFVMAYQIGYVGLFLFWVFWFSSVSYLFKNIKNIKSSDAKILLIAVVISSVGYFFTGWMSEQILTFTSVSHYWILLGLVTRMVIQNQEDLSENIV